MKYQVENRKDGLGALEIARDFSKAQGAKKVTIRGDTRTMGAGPGRKPREIEIEVSDND